MKSERSLDKRKIIRSFSAAAKSYDGLASLQRQVGRELLEKFPVQAMSGAILDLGCGTGYLTGQLALDSASQLIALDIAMPMLHASREKNQAESVQYICADAENMPFVAQSIRQIYSNLAFQWCSDLPAVFAECRRMLQTEGQLVFATFGPGTLQELKKAWAEVDAFVHVNEFFDRQQIAGFLEEGGFQSISCDSVIYQSRYASVMALMLELKGIGAHNVNFARNRKTTTRKQLQHMIGCYEKNMAGAALYASYEIIFVQAQL